MKIRACPLCRQVRLIPSGATVTCDACSFPMTGRTLSMLRESETEELERITDFQQR